MSAVPETGKTQVREETTAMAVTEPRVCPHGVIIGGMRCELCEGPGAGVWLAAAPGLAEFEGFFITRERLIKACASRAVGGTLEMLEHQGGSPEDLADAILGALGEETAA